MRSAWVPSNAAYGLSFCVGVAVTLTAPSCAILSAPCITVLVFSLIHELTTRDTTDEVRLDMRTTPLHLVAIIGSVAGAAATLLLT